MRATFQGWNAEHHLTEKDNLGSSCILTGQPAQVSALGSFLLGAGRSISMDLVIYHGRLCLPYLVAIRELP